MQLIAAGVVAAAWSLGDAADAVGGGLGGAETTSAQGEHQDLAEWLDRWRALASSDTNNVRTAGRLPIGAGRRWVADGLEEMETG